MDNTVSSSLLDGVQNAVQAGSIMETLDDELAVSKKVIIYIHTYHTVHIHTL